MFNNEKTLKRIESIKTNLAVDELFVVDGGSSDLH